MYILDYIYHLIVLLFLKLMHTSNIFVFDFILFYFVLFYFTSILQITHIESQLFYYFLFLSFIFAVVNI